MPKVAVKLKDRSYDVHVGEGIAANLGRLCIEAGLASPATVIIAEGLVPAWLEGLRSAFEAAGTVLSRQVFTAYPSMFCWNSLARWELDGQTCFGEDQDVWSPRRWRRFARSLSAAATSGGSGA